MHQFEIYIALVKVLKKSTDIFLISIEKNMLWIIIRNDLLRCNNLCLNGETRKIKN